jgi:KUP system potassium uptake protein
MMTETSESTPIKDRRAIPPAALAAMGIVFGDIGTSPLYTLQIAVKAANPLATCDPYCQGRRPSHGRRPRGCSSHPR